MCVGKLTIIGSNNGLSPERRQAIIWTIAGILLIGLLETNFSEVLIDIQTFSLKKIRLKMSSAKCSSFRLGLNVLIKFMSLHLTKIKVMLKYRPVFITFSCTGTCERNLCLDWFSLWCLSANYPFRDEVIAWKRFPHYWPFVGESTGHRWIPLEKEQWCDALRVIRL